MHGSIYPQKLQYKCLTRRAHDNSDHLTDKILQGRKDEQAVSLWGEDIYREKCPWFPKCPGQVLGVGVSKMLLCSIGLNKRLLASDWSSQVESEECLLLHVDGNAGPLIVP